MVFSACRIQSNFCFVLNLLLYCLIKKIIIHLYLGKNKSISFWKIINVLKNEKLIFLNSSATYSKTHPCILLAPKLWSKTLVDVTSNVGKVLNLPVYILLNKWVFGSVQEYYKTTVFTVPARFPKYCS